MDAIPLPSTRLSEIEAEWSGAAWDGPALETLFKQVQELLAIARAFEAQRDEYQMAHAEAERDLAALRAAARKLLRSKGPYMGDPTFGEAIEELKALSGAARVALQPRPEDNQAPWDKSEAPSGAAEADGAVEPEGRTGAPAAVSPEGCPGLRVVSGTLHLEPVSMLVDQVGPTKHCPGCPKGVR